MRLATIDPQSQKKETKFYKIPKFGVYKLNRPNSKPDTAIWKCPKNLSKKCMANRTLNAVRTAWSALYDYVNQ